eukprot:GHVN01097461.1.p2 GENE.GHVN01097461.1~~GHVN01097461.1.p2  ORF type:complete len:108 (-),score=13.84 GHVN01097461.1:133-456(-)
MKDVFETVEDVFENALEDGEDVLGENGEPRQLGKKKKAAKHAEPVTVGGGGEGAYCAYGCGRLSGKCHDKYCDGPICGSHLTHTSLRSDVPLLLPTILWVWLPPCRN